MIIELTDARKVPSSSITHTIDGNGFSRFFLSSGEDITQKIYRHDKRLLVPDFDDETENIRMSIEHGSGAKVGGVKPLEENTAVILADQLITDPLGAPADVLANSVDRVTGASSFKKASLILIVGVVLYIAVKKSLI